eukprot:355202-Ditylum_brightwellii.AAC.1
MNVSIDSAYVREEDDEIITEAESVCSSENSSSVSSGKSIEILNMVYQMDFYEHDGDDIDI